MTDRTDNFNRTASSSTINSPSDGLGDYTVGAGTWGIATGGATGYESATTSQASCYLETSQTAGYIQVTVSTFSADVGLVGRVQDSTHYILGAVTAGQTFRVFMRSGASFTQRGSTSSVTMNSGDVIKLDIASDGTIVLSQNGTARVTTSDTTYATETKWGLRTHNDTTSRFDDLSFVGAGGASFVSCWAINSNKLIQPGVAIA